MSNYKFHRTAPAGDSPKDRKPKSKKWLTNFSCKWPNRDKKLN